VVLLLVAACSDGHTDVRSQPAAGWPMYGGNEGNANFSHAQVPDGLELSWTRPTGGPITAPLTLNASGDVGVTAKTPNGCNTFVFAHDSGRKNFCKAMREGVQFNALAFDQYSQPFIGEETTFLSFNGGGAIRWRMPVVGVPVSAKFAAPGTVLTVTQRGQVLLLNAQTGDFQAPELRLWPDVDPADPLNGLGDCVNGGPACAVSAPPAVDPQRHRFFLNFVPQGAKVSQVQAMSYRVGSNAESGALGANWSAELPGGVMGPPALSHDGQTVYAFSRSGSLFALAADSGEVKWHYDLGGFGFATLSVSPDGLIIPTSTLGGPLTILKDDGDKAELVTRRTDVQTVGLAAQTTAGTAWTVLREGDDQHLVLTEVSTKDGATKRSLPLPDAVGFTTGVAVSASGSVAVATNLGQVYYFSG